MLFVCSVIAASGSSNTVFVASKVLTIPCILSARVVEKKGQSEESDVVKMSYLIQKANKDQMSKKDPRDGCMLWIHTGWNKGLVFAV